MGQQDHFLCQAFRIELDAQPLHLGAQIGSQGLQPFRYFLPNFGNQGSDLTDALQNRLGQYLAFAPTTVEQVIERVVKEHQQALLHLLYVEFGVD